MVSACLRFNCAPLEKFYIKSHFKYKFQSAVDSLTGSAPKCALLWYFLSDTSRFLLVSGRVLPASKWVTRDPILIGAMVYVS